VGRSSSIPDEGATSDGPSVVSASRRVCAMFSITDPGFMSAKFGFLAAFAFRARFLSACKYHHYHHCHLSTAR